jgi:hypothetical protein
MKTKSQAGFTLVEGLLLLIAIALVVFVGFYVYNANRNTDKLVSKGAASTPKSASSTPAQRYLPIKELGIKIPLSGKLASLEYSIAPADSMTADFSTKAFAKAVGECKSTDTASSSFPTLLAVTKTAGQYDSNSPPQDFFSAFAVQFPDFYLTDGAPDGGYCTGTDQAKNKAVQTLFDQISPALKEAVKNAKQI